MHQVRSNLSAHKQTPGYGYTKQHRAIRLPPSHATRSPGSIAAPSAPIRISIDSAIPPAAGLGSGAAVSVAIARVLGRYFGIELEAGTLSDLAYEVEIIHHGSPSGVDNTVIAYEKPVFFIRGRLLKPSRSRSPFTLVLAHSGEETPTATAVGRVRDLWKAEPGRNGGFVSIEIGEITQAAYSGTPARPG